MLESCQNRAGNASATTQRVRVFRSSTIVVVILVGTHSRSPSSNSMTLMHRKEIGDVIEASGVTFLGTRKCYGKSDSTAFSGLRSFLVFSATSLRQPDRAALPCPTTAGRLRRLDGSRSWLPPASCPLPPAHRTPQCRTGSPAFPTDEGTCHG